MAQAGVSAGSALARFVVPALEQLHQAPMVALPGAKVCLRTLKAAGFKIAVCSNWGWDLRADLEATGLTADIDFLVTSAQAGFRKPHPWIYQSTLGLAGFTAGEAVFVGDSLRTDVLGPRTAQTVRLCSLAYAGISSGCHSLRHSARIWLVFVIVREDLIHRSGAILDHGPDLEAVNGLGGSAASTSSACSRVSALDGRPGLPLGVSHSRTTFRFTLSRACAL